MRRPHFGEVCLLNQQPGDRSERSRDDHRRQEKGANASLVARDALAKVEALTLGWREAIVVAVAVPVTLVLTLLINYLYGYTLTPALASPFQSPSHFTKSPTTGNDFSGIWPFQQGCLKQAILLVGKSGLKLSGKYWGFDDDHEAFYTPLTQLMQEFSIHVIIFCLTNDCRQSTVLAKGNAVANRGYPPARTSRIKKSRHFEWR